MKLNYAAIMQRWRDYEAGIDDHDCVKEEFHRCEICEQSWDAGTELRNNLDVIIQLLKRTHTVLEDLTQNVIQETPTPRPEALQKALKKALDVVSE